MKTLASFAVIAGCAMLLALVRALMDQIWSFPSPKQKVWKLG